MEITLLISWFLWNLIAAREDSQLRLIKVPLRCLRNVHVVEYTLVSHNHEVVVLHVERYRLQLLLNLDLGCTPLRIEVFVYKLHELQPILY